MQVICLAMMMGWGWGVGEGAFAGVGGDGIGEGGIEKLYPWIDDPWAVLIYGYGYHLVRYLLIAGGAFVLFYVLLRAAVARRKVQPMGVSRAQYQRELGYSLMTFGVFALVGVGVYGMYKMGWTMLYFEVDKIADRAGNAYWGGVLEGWGWWYVLLSVVVMIVLHDTWFYWTHRWLHRPGVFRRFHAVHHASRVPSPWASFSFHPVEALVQAGVFPLMVVMIPIHPVAGGVWFLYMTVMNVGGHLGYELFPRGFVRGKIWKWHNTTTHHDMHHRLVHCHYGLYFNVWDRLMGTNHAGYEEAYEKVTRKERRDSGVKKG